jgi:hypothetical protein
VGKPEGKKPLGRPRSRLVNNITMDIKEIGWGGLDWNDLAQDRDQWRVFVKTVLGNSLVAAQLAASQEGLSSMSEYTVSKVM